MQFIKLWAVQQGSKENTTAAIKNYLKHFKNLVKSTLLIVCLKDRKLLKLTESGTNCSID